MTGPRTERREDEVKENFTLLEVTAVFRSGLADTKSFVDSSILSVSVLPHLSALAKGRRSWNGKNSLNHSAAVWVIREKDLEQSFSITFYINYLQTNVFCYLAAPVRQVNPVCWETSCFLSGLTLFAVGCLLDSLEGRLTHFHVLIVQVRFRVLNSNVTAMHI